MSTMFPDTATLCKTEAAEIARASALAAAVDGEVRIIGRFVLWAVVTVFLFSGAGGAFAQAPQLTKQIGATTIPVHGSTMRLMR